MFERLSGKASLKSQMKKKKLKKKEKEKKSQMNVDIRTLGSLHKEKGEELFKVNELLGKVMIGNQ